MYECRFAVQSGESTSMAGQVGEREVGSSDWRDKPGFDGGGQEFGFLQSGDG